MARRRILMLGRKILERGAGAGSCCIAGGILLSLVGWLVATAATTSTPADRPLDCNGDTCLRMIRGSGPVAARVDDWGIDFQVELLAPPGYSLGYLGVGGGFVPCGISGDQPSGMMTFFPGSCFQPALRWDATGGLGAAGGLGTYLPLGEPFPATAGLDPEPDGPYYGRIEILFPPLADSVSATFDATIVMGDSMPYGNGFELVPLILDDE